MIKNMKHWNYARMDFKYQEDQWIIWLENYEHYAELCITNECSHSFHTKCLKEWYLNTDPSQPFRCPHCNTINRRLLNSLSRSLESGESRIENSNILKRRDRVDYPNGPHVNMGLSRPNIPAHNLASIDVAL